MWEQGDLYFDYRTPWWEVDIRRSPLFPPDTEPGLNFPVYFRLASLHAAIGLRFKRYGLRTLWEEDRPACLWCHAPHAEYGIHLTTSPC